MGYAAHRAWTIGTASLIPTTVQLTKVRNGRHCDIFEIPNSCFPWLARRNALHYAAWSEPYLDAPLLWASAAY